MDPGFYSVDVGVLVNQDTWKGLNDAQRKVLTDAAAWLETLDATENADLVKAERERQAKAGVQTIDLGPDVAQHFQNTANTLARDADAGLVDDPPEEGT